MNQAAIIAKDVGAKRKLYDFHGGIHPPGVKELSNSTPIQIAPIPPKLIIPVGQHIGSPADPIVNVGDYVLKGQVIAEDSSFVSAPIHAPSSGTISSIETRPIAHPSGMSDLCITIDTDGKDQWCELSVCEDYSTLSRDEIQARVRAAGITGMGGAGFPTSVKLSPPKQHKIATFVINAVECEPYITSDDRLMRERADQLISGIEIMAHVLEPGEVVIGIEDNKPEAIEAVRKAANGTQIQVAVVPTKYPSGGEKQLIKVLTGKEVPSGKIPADIGVVCQNVGTIVAVYRALRFGEPLISRICTLTGESMGQPGNVEALIGTPIDWLIEQYGFKADKRQRLIMGGPMMGFTLQDSNVGLVKTTNCILAPSTKEQPLPAPAQACIRCGMCADACPAELLPQQLYWFSKANEFEKAEHHNLFDCIECGACSYVCPSSIPLVQYYRYAKGEIRQSRAEHVKAEQAKQRFEFKQLRVEREKEEKEAKRKARAAAAAKAQAEKQAAAASAKSETNSDTTIDPRKAAVQAALERTKSKQAASAEEEVNIPELEEAVSKAQAKLEKTKETLEDAKANNPDMVSKLTRAVEKNQMRLIQAQKALASAQEKTAVSETGESAAPASPEEIEQLKDQLAKAEQKLEKMQASLEEAQKNTPELVEKLTRAVEKNVSRVDQAKQNLESALRAAAGADDAANKEEYSEPKHDIDALKLAVEKAEAKVEKMQQALSDAEENNPDQVEKLTRAVEKNKVRLAQAQTELDNALNETEKAPEAENTAETAKPAADPEALKVALEKAEAKLEKMQDALEDAKVNNPEQVEKLSRAVEKNINRVAQAKQALQDASPTE